MTNIRSLEHRTRPGTWMHRTLVGVALGMGYLTALPCHAADLAGEEGASVAQTTAPAAHSSSSPTEGMVPATAVNSSSSQPEGMVPAAAAPQNPAGRDASRMAAPMASMNAEGASAPVGSTTETSAPPQVPTAELEAAAQYRLGLFLMGQARFDEAAGLFEKVITHHPRTPFAEPAKQRLTELQALKKAPATQQPGHATALANSGRAEFVVTQTAAGLYLGAVLPFLLNVESEQGYALSVMAGTVAGLGGSLLYSREHPISSGQASLISYSQLFGTGNLLMWTLAISNGDYDEKVPVALSLVGLAGGTLVGKMLGDRYDISEGRVSAIASTGLWATGLTELALFALEFDNERAALALAPLAADIGLLAASQLTGRPGFAISRSRVRLINMSGLVGLVLAIGSSVVLDIEFDQPFFGMMFAGSVVGLGIGIKATSNWDPTYHPELFTKAPVNSVVALEDGRLKLGNPVPSIAWIRAGAPGTVEGNKRVPQVGLNLMGGQF